MSKFTIPSLRNLIPKSLAQDIVGVQPMPAAAGRVFTMKDNKVAFRNYVIVHNQNEAMLYDTLDCKYYAVDVKPAVEKWLIDQPTYMWKNAEETEDCHLFFTRYIINEELLTWMTLRWG